MTPSDDYVLSPQRDSPRWVWLLWASPAAAVPSATRRALVAGLILVGAVAMAWSGYVHLKLWNMENGYAQLPTVGKMFLLQGIACLVLAVGVVALRRLVVVVLAALLMAASIGGLVISVHRTLFGYQESMNVPYKTSSLVVESVAVAAFVAAVIVAVTASRPSA
jgi:hypothetical protein